MISFDISEKENYLYKKHKKYYTLIVLFLNFSSTAYATAYNYLFPLGVMLATIVSLIAIPKLNHNKLSKNILSIFFILFILSLFLSTLFHFEISLFLTFFGMTCSFLLFNYFRTSLTKDLLIHVLVLYIFIHFLLIMISILLNGFQLLSFTGIFRNSNSMGLVSLTAIACIISLLNIIGIKSNKIYIILIILFLITCVASSSRTASLISLIIIFISPFLNGIYFSKKTVFSLFLSLSAIIIILNTSFFSESIIMKFQKYADQGDVLNERNEVWDVAFKNINLFGNGRDAALENHLGESIFISLMFQFGLLSLFIFVLLIIFTILLQFPKKNTRLVIYRFSLLPISISFILEGLTTSVFGSSIYWLWIFGLGFSIYEINKNLYFNNYIKYNQLS